ncbi:MAG: hypothetical protein HRU20_04190 [Pseudomonadales bacterium]|nr:hypothetical protein [Pseudomonadales bacterium]
MTKILSLIAFALGAIAVCWVGSTFIHSNVLALLVTTLIAAAYCIGFIELMRFQQATKQLTSALNTIQSEITDLSRWLNTLPNCLQNASRLRIEGERVGLPGPILTPYLVGLLVMLGLLGTFIGMVDTLKGAVIAMQSSTELETIRAGLTAPIKGLGLAFGTSVAGVTASALLGLISTLSRRERLIASRLLDDKINTQLRSYSLSHNRQQSYAALQGLAGQFERLGENMGNRLLANQDKFHESVAKVYTDLANSVDKSLKESLAASGQLAGESIKPIIADAMAEITTSFSRNNEQWLKTQQHSEHERLQQLSATIEATQQQTKEQLSHTVNIFSDEITKLATQQQQVFKHSTENMTAMSDQLNTQWQETSTLHCEQQQQMASHFEQQVQQLTQAQHSAFTRISDDMAVLSDTLSTQWHTTSKQNIDTQQQQATAFNQQIQQMSSSQSNSLEAITENFSSLTNTLSTQWSQAGEQSTAQQQKMAESLQLAAGDIAENTQANAESMLAKMNTLLSSSEALVEARTTAESEWLDNHSLRMSELSSTLKTQLSGLRDEEANRGQAAIERLADLESAVAKQLETLGNALEEPMTRLIETASETPKAAAEVIAQMRGEISKNIEKDNSMLEERQRIMADLNTVSDALHQTSSMQQQAAEQIVNTSARVLEDVGAQFTHHLEAQLGKITNTVDHFSGSAVEMNAMGESFSLAIQLFNESNTLLIDKLSAIESAMDKSSSRSDEQMNYYVAQARELIDHSVLSQKEIFEELRQIGKQNELFAVEAG